MLIKFIRQKYFFFVMNMVLKIKLKRKKHIQFLLNSLPLYERIEDDEILKDMLKLHYFYNNLEPVFFMIKLHHFYKTRGFYFQLANGLEYNFIID